MLTDEQIALLTDEQKAELLTKLQPKTVVVEVKPTEVNPEVVIEPAVDPVVETPVVVQPVVEQPVIPDYNEKFMELEKKFESINALLIEKDKTITDLSKKMKDLEERTPTGVFTPKVSNPEEQAGKDRAKKMLEQYKTGYRA